MRYNISSSQTARINFDEIISQDIEETKVAGVDFNSWWNIASEQYDVDDTEEAEARAQNVWARVQEAR